MTSPICKKIMAALGFFLGMSLAHAAPVYESSTLTFNDLANSAGGTHIASGYGGFNWGSSMYSMTPAGSENDFVAFANTGTFITRTDGQAFYFDGADFFLRPGADTNDFAFVLYGAGGATVYNGLTEKYGKNKINFGDPSSLFQPVTEVDNEAGPAYSGLITGMAIAWDNQSWGDFGMDNFRFRALASTPALVSAVPEPHTFAMLLLGLGLMGGAARRQSGIARGS